MKARRKPEILQLVQHRTNSTLRLSLTKATAYTLQKSTYIALETEDKVNASWSFVNNNKILYPKLMGKSQRLSNNRPGLSNGYGAIPERRRFPLDAALHTD